MAGLFFGIVITRSEGLISHSLVWLRKKAEEILLLSIRDRARWKARSANGMQLRTAEADTSTASFPTPSRSPWQSDQILHPLDKGGSPPQPGTEDGRRQGGSSLHLDSYNLPWKMAPLGNGSKKTALFVVVVIFFCPSTLDKTRLCTQSP